MSDADQPLFEIAGMAPEDAKSYVFSLTTHLKKTEAELATVESDIAKWERHPELAEAKLSELRASREVLIEEVAQFQAGVAKLKRDLLHLPLTQRSVNTDQLLEQMAALGGALDTVTPVTKNVEADEALAALKRRLASG